MGDIRRGERGTSEQSADYGIREYHASPELLVKGCKFLEQDYKKMVLVIKYVMKSPELMQKLLLVQQRKKKAIWKEILKEE